jgi:hypothetical protein
MFGRRPVRRERQPTKKIFMFVYASLHKKRATTAASQVPNLGKQLLSAIEFIVRHQLSHGCQNIDAAGMETV